MVVVRPEIAVPTVIARADKFAKPTSVYPVRQMRIVPQVSCVYRGPAKSGTAAATAIVQVDWCVCLTHAAPAAAKQTAVPDKFAQGESVKSETA